MVNFNFNFNRKDKSSVLLIMIGLGKKAVSQQEQFLDPNFELHKSDSRSSKLWNSAVTKALRVTKFFWANS